MNKGTLIWIGVFVFTFSLVIILGLGIFSLVEGDLYFATIMGLFAIGIIFTLSYLISLSYEVKQN